MDRSVRQKFSVCLASVCFASIPIIRDSVLPAFGKISKDIKRNWKHSQIRSHETPVFQNLVAIAGEDRDYGPVVAC